MKILIAPDSFKDCLTATDVALNIEAGIRRVLPRANIVKIPLSDGGEGFVDTMLAALGGKKTVLLVSDPLNRKINAAYGILNDKKTAVIEMAAASGIEHLKREKRNPMFTTTYGTGQLMKDAIEKGCRKLIIGIGGSATNDGGTGMAKALGYCFLDKKGQEIKQGGGALQLLDQINADNKFSLLNETEIIVACDVTNPLIGKKGASAVYGPQKGATPAMVFLLDKNLTHLACIIKKDLNINILELPGGGAAGGLGAGLVAFANGTLKAGFEIVKEQTGLEDVIQQSDIVFTGEGKIDGQTKQGKTPWGVAQIAKKYNKPVIALAGVLGNGYRELCSEGFTALFALPNSPASPETCIANAPGLLANTAEQIIRVVCQ